MSRPEWDIFLPPNHKAQRTYPPERRFEYLENATWRVGAAAARAYASSSAAGRLARSVSSLKSRLMNGSSGQRDRAGSQSQVRANSRPGHTDPKIAPADIQPLILPRLLPIWNRCPWIALIR